MKKIFKQRLIWVVAAVIIFLGFPKCHAQKFEMGLGADYTFYTHNKVEIVEAIQLYNWNRPGSQQLPELSVKGENLFAPVVWGKYKLQDGDSPISLGVELKFGKGVNIATFADYEILISDANFRIFARPQLSLGYNSSFPVKLDWGEFLSKNIPYLNVDELEEGVVLFKRVSPSSLGSRFNLCVTPKLDVEKEITEWLIVRGSFGYSLDAMRLLRSISQDGINFDVGIVTRW